MNQEDLERRLQVLEGRMKAAVDAVKRSSSKLPRPTKSKPPPKPWARDPMP